MFSRGFYAALTVGLVVLDVVPAARRPHLGSASHREQERAREAVRDATQQKFLSPRAANSTSRFLNNATESQYNPCFLTGILLTVYRICRRLLA